VLSCATCEAGYVSSRIKALPFIGLGVIALMIFLALASYHPEDPGFSFTGDGQQVGNLIGRGGAWFADVLYFLFGGPAYLLPLMIGFTCVVMLRRPAPAADRTTLPLSRANTLLRFGGFAVLLAASCALASLHWNPGALRQSAGGVVGSLLGTSLATGVDFLGATLLLLGLWMAGVALAFGISWLTVIDRLGAAAFAAWDWYQARRQSARDSAEGEVRKAERKENVQAESKKAATRARPRIETATPAVEKSERVDKERQAPLFDNLKAGELPPLQLLEDPPAAQQAQSAEALEAMSRFVELKLKEFGVDVEVVAVLPGPVVTRYEIRPAPGTKASSITALSRDLARALSTTSVRVVEVIPGKSVMGLEIPNEKREIVTLGEIVKSRAYDEISSPLALALGKDIGGAPMVADLTRMPHLLIAGTTGSGKSVALNAMVLSLLYKSTAEHVRMIMVDPKMLELSVYEGIPHLLTPVVTDMKQAANALRWCVAEMERRYQLMSALGVRNIGGYNRKVKDATEAGKPIVDPVMLQRAANDPSIDQKAIPVLTPLPYIVVIVDELADMMMTVGKKVEELIARLAQKARASGIHLVLATQRPSVDVITGLIKANIPCRIAFQVSSRVDSRTILDQMGAESLLGHGDMLYLPAGTAQPTRVHGAFVGDAEVHRVVEALKKSAAPNYIDEVLAGAVGPLPGIPGEEGAFEDSADAEQDALYDDAVKIVVTERKPSISYVQRRLKIGYNRAARLLEAMEAAGVVGPLQSNGAREILVPASAGN
jgi:S-DNA-T family DNA segregation ATPase FtsK/SpoIIIE